MEIRQLPVTGEFSLVRPETIEEAVLLLQKHGDRASLLSGGTDLLVAMRAGKRTPELVIDLKRVSSIRNDILDRGDALEIGALAPLVDIVSDERVRADFPVLCEAAATVGSVQIRNRATLAGNICNASPAADTVPALMVHKALVDLHGARGPRRLPLGEFFVGPGKTARESDEILTSITLPKPEEPTGAAFSRLTRRYGVDLASINVACLVTASGAVRFAFGAVGPRPVYAEERGGRLSDQDLPSEERDRAIQELIAATSPISDVRASREYRSAMLLVMSRRTLLTAISRLKESLKED